MGGRQAGCISLLTLFAAGCTPTAVATSDELVGRLAETLGLPMFSSIHDPGFQESLSRSDLLVSVHGREIVPDRMLNVPPLGGINVHPCLYRYKGANPVARLLQDGNRMASVGVHRMTQKIDEGDVLIEEFVQVEQEETVIEVYNALYPSYAIALTKALKIMQQTLDSERCQKSFFA